jgi:hypothetical protein
MDVKEEKVVTAFLARWREYLIMLRQDATSGASLHEDEIAAMSDDQRQQLNRLRTTLMEEKEKDF